MTTRPRIQHVSIPRPFGSAAEARAFYGELLRLHEVAVPHTLVHLDLIWFKLGDTELHLFAEKPREDSSGRHVCIEVDELDALHARLMAANYVPTADFDIHGRPRFFCRDPFGNQIEFTTIISDYLAANV